MAIFATMSAAIAPVMIASAPPFANACSDAAYAGFVRTVPSAFGVPSALKKYAVASASRFRLAAFDEMAAARRPPILKPFVDSAMPSANRSLNASLP